ncbi:MAG: CinA family nicotinamide mononucleotide deamidase-related protein [Nitriliruptorales bacterium]|nr:CinA family nicotinamide mononucleotide deamidase-related protein [Nitriliruptorales bacterium]
MRVGICSVGAELVSGEVADTNAAWLARRVLESGGRVVAELLVGDDRDAIAEALQWLARRADVLVVGGGLGPTADDLTRYAVADFAGVKLGRRRALVEHLEDVYSRLGLAMPPSNLCQADVPVGAQVYDPPGTAAGFALDVAAAGRDVRVHVIPGVPWEYRTMAERDVLPDLLGRSGGVARVTRTLRVVGVGESSVGEQLRELSDRLVRAAGDPEDPAHGIDLGFLAGSDEILVRVTVAGPTPAAARDRAAPVVAEIADRLGVSVVSVDEQKLEDEVARLLRAASLTVVTAEGCTAGRIAARLAGVDGATDYFRGGVVAYAPDTLPQMLALSPEVLSRHGRVSAEAAEAMATTARQLYGTDIAVAATGVEGPRRPEGDPEVGTVWWAVALPDGTVHTHERFIPGDREIVQARTAAFALGSLREHLLILGSSTLQTG